MRSSNEPSRRGLRHGSFFRDQQNIEGSDQQDFCFKEDDTIAIVELMEYKQHQTINRNVDEVSKEKEQRTSNVSKDQASLGSDNVRLMDKEDDDDQLMVRHLIQVKNTRFLYTTKVHDIISHHLVKGFDYKRFRKTDYIDVEQ